MNTKTKAISKYEEFVSGSRFSCFMQSENWAKVKSKWKSEQIILSDEFGSIEGTMQILIRKIPFLNTSLMYSPRGPVCDLHDKKVLKRLADSARLLAEKYNAFLLKTDPMIEVSDKEAVENLKSVGFEYNENISEDHTVQSLKNYILRIEGKTEEEVFASFDSKWRYKIRLASRKGVVCDCNSRDIEHFHILMKETGERDGFNIRSKEYFSCLLDAFGDNARLFMCYAPDGQAISGALAIRYGDRVSYVYGASGNGHRNLMPNYLMQWNMIQWAISSGCSIYDFMGIPHYDDQKHPNYGVYQFKKGFNGKVVVYAGEFDMVFSKLKRREVQFMLRLSGYKRI